MPTKRRRHAVTETPAVEAALEELRREAGSDPIRLGELVVLGAAAKVKALRDGREDAQARRDRLAQRVRDRSAGADVALADEVRRRGWAR